MSDSSSEQTSPCKPGRSKSILRETVILINRTWCALGCLLCFLGGGVRDPLEASEPRTKMSSVDREEFSLR